MPGPFEELEKEAETLENRSKEEFNKKNYISAINFLEEAKKMYSKLGYHGKIGMLDKRISQLKNLVKFETQDTYVKTKAEENFQRYTEKVFQEKKLYGDNKHLGQTALSPEMKQNLKKIELILEKAEREEKLGKYSRVMGRYEYLLELYKSIPKEVVNFSKQIHEIEKKLEMIREKL
ncbi:MAG: hypothetical protein ACFFA4_10760 [Promethearchaeota archaeon]